MSSSTSTLHHHLAGKHLAEWISACKKAGIKITATSKDVRKALEKLGGDDAIGLSDTVPAYRSYTPKAFTEAIVKWIVADDQVRLYIIFTFCNIYVFCS